MSKPVPMVTITIDGLTEAQLIALEDLFATWMSLGNMGSSRWTAFYADGDGDFHPKVLVNGRKPVMTELVSKEERWGLPKQPGEMYWMDFDRIAWRLRDGLGLPER
jgi:hypothetical protein